MAVFLFLVGTVLLILGPIIQPLVVLEKMYREAQEQVTIRLHRVVGPPATLDTAARLAKTASFALVPIRIVVETLQIISSFKRTMRLAWPHVFNYIIQRLSFLNFTFRACPYRARRCHCPALTPSLCSYPAYQRVLHAVAGLLRNV